MRAPIRSALCVVLALLAVMVFSASASAIVSEVTGWETFSEAYPTNLHPGESGLIIVHILNIGATPSHGSITVTDTLPTGMTATKVGGMLTVSHEPFSQKEEEEGTPLLGEFGVAGDR